MGLDVSFVPRARDIVSEADDQGRDGPAPRERARNRERLHRGEAPIEPDDRRWSIEEVEFAAKYGIDAFTPREDTAAE